MLYKIHIYVCVCVQSGDFSTVKGIRNKKWILLWERARMKPLTTRKSDMGNYR